LETKFYLENQMTLFVSEKNKNTVHFFRIFFKKTNTVDKGLSLAANIFALTKTNNHVTSNKHISTIRSFKR